MNAIASWVVGLIAWLQLTCTHSLQHRVEKRERRREAKAEVAARLDKAIESELLKRLQAGTYGDIYNFPTKQYQRVLDAQEVEGEGEELAAQEALEEEVEEFVEGDEDEEEEFDDEVGGYVCAGTEEGWLYLLCRWEGRWRKVRSMMMSGAVL